MAWSRDQTEEFEKREKKSRRKIPREWVRELKHDTATSENGRKMKRSYKKHLYIFCVFEESFFLIVWPIDSFYWYVGPMSEKIDFSFKQRQMKVYTKAFETIRFPHFLVRWQVFVLTKTSKARSNKFNPETWADILGSCVVTTAQLYLTGCQTLGVTMSES